MDKLVLHPRTKGQVSLYMKQLPHAVLLRGSEGMGKYHLATFIARQIKIHAITVEAEDSKSTISIDQIRSLYQLTRTGNELFVIIKDAHQMGREAQNAFLKLLEEPPQNTRFILTAHSSTKLLPTILSRTQQIEVLAPSQADLLKYLQSHHLNEELAKRYIYALGNRIGTITTLIGTSELKQSFDELLQTAKAFYSGRPYLRHQLLIQNNYEKQWAKELLELLTSIVSQLLKHKATNSTTLARLKHQARLLEDTAKRLFEIQGNPKIQLSRLAEEL